MTCATVRIPRYISQQSVSDLIDLHQQATRPTRSWQCELWVAMSCTWRGKRGPIQRARESGHRVAHTGQDLGRLGNQAGPKHKSGYHRGPVTSLATNYGSCLTRDIPAAV